MNRDELIDLLERSTCMAPIIPKKINSIPIKSVQGYFLPFSDAEMNCVQLSDCQHNQINQKIREVREFFREENKAFSWWFGSNENSKLLKKELELADFKKNA